MNELGILLDRFGWQGGTIHQARAEARRRGWRSFLTTVLVAYPRVEKLLTGVQDQTIRVRVWGKDKSHALEASGIQ